MISYLFIFGKEKDWSNELWTQYNVRQAKASGLIYTFAAGWHTMTPCPWLF